MKQLPKYRRETLLKMNGNVKNVLFGVLIGEGESLLIDTHIDSAGISGHIQHLVRRPETTI